MAWQSSAPCYDAVIVGGAMAGASLALGLAQLSRQLERPLSLALIEPHPPGASGSGFDARAIAVAHGSRFLLRQLGIWPLLNGLGTPIRDIHVSDRGHFGMTELNAAPLGVDAFGEVVELERVGQRLFHALQRSEVTLLCPAELVALESVAEGHLLTLSDGRELQCRLLLAADGANSRVRQLQGQPQQQQEFGQSALIANIGLSQPHGGKAWERFTDHGPIALLPMADCDGVPRVSLVWAMAQSQLPEVLALDDAEFVAALQQAFGYRAGRFISAGVRHSYPLSLSWMPRPAYHRTIYLGNAAQTLHPIAGQGFNLGLRDIAALLQLLPPLLSAGLDIGSAEVIHRYLQAREQDQQQTLAAINALVRGFSNNDWPLVLGRNLGLRLLSWLPPLKTPLAQRAMGWHGSAAWADMTRSR